MEKKTYFKLEVVIKPLKCNDCIFFREHSYQNHNERGIERDCRLGFYDGDIETRDASQNDIHRCCKLIPGATLEIKSVLGNLDHYL